MWVLLTGIAFGAEVCDDGGDDDGDGLADCADPDCDADGDAICDAEDACAGPGDGLSLFAPAATLDSTNYLASDIVLVDVDGDGVVEPVVAKVDAFHCPGPYGAYCNVPSELAWYEGSPARTFTTHPISASVDYAFTGVNGVDVDGDGDRDVVRSYFDGDYQVHDNVGGVFGPPVEVPTVAFDPTVGRLADFDGDGDADLVSGSETPTTFWYVENTGGGTWAPKVSIETVAGNEIQHVAVGDLDGDGDLDPIANYSSAAQGLVWFDNLGGGNFGPRHQVDSGYEADLDPVDVDGDGDLDLLTAGDTGTRLYLNDGTGTFGAAVILSADADRATAGDIDDDGDVDVILSSPGILLGSEQLSWARNMGGGVFAAETSIGLDGFAAEAGDIDGDGDVDLVAWDELNSITSLLVWYENRSDCRADTDGDGLLDPFELLVHGTDPANRDTDHASVGDGLEVANGTDPTWGGDDLPPSTLTLLSGAGVGPYLFDADQMPQGSRVVLLASRTLGALLGAGCTQPTPLGLGAPTLVRDMAFSGPLRHAFLDTTFPAGAVGDFYFVAAQPNTCRVSDVVQVTLP